MSRFAEYSLHLFAGEIRGLEKMTMMFDKMTTCHLIDAMLLQKFIFQNTVPSRHAAGQRAVMSAIHVRVHYKGKAKHINSSSLESTASRISF